jgi:hypothetical protein
MTRRSLVRRGALAGLALTGARAGAAGAQQLPAGRRPIVRAVALGPGGLGVEQSYAANRNRFVDTGTPWVRLWADWPRIQPAADQPPDLAALDADVALAKADGVRVILTAWRFAPWANAAPHAGDPARDVTFRVADDLSPDGAWGRWIELLIARYSGKADILEIVNEPNLQLWPQTGIDSAVATMMQTAAEIAGRHPGAPLLAGPATADVTSGSPAVTGYDSFTRALLARLEERGFRPGPGFAWSHHNYTDVEGDLAGARNRVGQVRALLRGNWAGWPAADAGNPGILITESGARIDKVGGRLNQAELLERNARRMLAGPEGEGVAMVCQYLFLTDANYDAGLCDLNGTPRPAYYAWSRLPTAR